MPRRLPTKFTKIVKPTRGFAHFRHIVAMFLLPLIIYILVRIDFVSLAIVLVLLSKWRMFAVRPRYWPANLIASSADILVSVALVLFMANTSIQWWQLFWTTIYGIWLIWLKPRSDVLSVSIQAMLAQLAGLAVLYLKFGDTSLVALVAGTWLVADLAARHFLTSFEEPHTALLAHVWAYFAAGLAFVLGHWLLFYGTVAQIIVILTTVGYGLGALYYLDSHERLTALLQRQLLAIMFAILLIVVVLSDWTGVTV
ncbi:hypothetical protein HY857_02610 [Candidatus Saccharibacteria bacterium]|nr:hypothetical protein [Candidatus Saccharibacteria bacterium]